MWRLPLPALLLCCSALAAPTAAAADAARGATLYAPCAACHGAQALGNPALQAPALAGQDAGYLARQLRNFRAGTRGATDGDTAGATMRAQLAPLPDDAAIDDVAAWLASLPAPRAAAVDGALLRNGSNYYQSKCGACHGARAEGNPRCSPRASPDWMPVTSLASTATSPPACAAPTPRTATGARCA